MMYRTACIVLSILGIVLAMFAEYPFNIAAWAIFGSLLALAATMTIFRKKRGVNDAKP